MAVKINICQIVAPVAFIYIVFSVRWHICKGRQTAVLQHPMAIGIAMQPMNVLPLRDSDFRYLHFFNYFCKAAFVNQLQLNCHPDYDLAVYSMNTKSHKMKKVGYVLSGGGARGFAHLGVIKYLEELGIKPYAIAGTSAGAIVGALYSAGKRPEEILGLMKNSNYFGWTNITWRKAGFFSMDVLRKLLQDTIGENNFSVLKTKLFVAATDLNKGEAIIFSEGKLFEAVIGSASIPVVFEPVVLNNALLVDGGVLNNFPLEPLTGICDAIIGSYVNKMNDGIGKNSSSQKVNIIDRCFHLAISSSVYSKVNQCDVFIESPLHTFDMYDVKQADKIFEIGYNTAKQFNEALINLAADNLPVA